MAQERTNKRYSTAVKQIGPGRTGSVCGGHGVILSRKGLADRGLHHGAAPSSGPW